jgi:DNA-binding response OmpR family regulator
MDMPTNPTVLCIHQDPAQLSSLQENGYNLLTAINGHEGLRLFASQPVDAIVLGYHLGLLDGPIVANEIKRVRPSIPIVMLADNLELPDDALNSVDALVTKSDGAHFLWATVHFVLNVKPAQDRKGKFRTRMPAPSRFNSSARQARHFQTRPTPDPKNAPFTAKEWRDIRMGTLDF